MQQSAFPLTILMKNGKLQITSMLSPDLTIPFLKRVIQELEVPLENREYAEVGESEDGMPDPLYEVIQGIDADALCLLSEEGAFIFILNSAYEKHETPKYQQLMREKLIQYIRQAPPLS